MVLEFLFEPMPLRTTRPQLFTHKTWHNIHTDFTTYLRCQTSQNKVYGWRTVFILTWSNNFYFKIGTPRNNSRSLVQTLVNYHGVRCWNSSKFLLVDHVKNLIPWQFVAFATTARNNERGSADDCHKHKQNDDQGNSPSWHAIIRARG